MLDGTIRPLPSSALPEVPPKEFKLRREVYNGILRSIAFGDRCTTCPKGDALKHLLWLLAPCQPSSNDGISSVAAEFTVSPVGSLAAALQHIRRTPVDLVLI